MARGALPLLDRLMLGLGRVDVLVNLGMQLRVTLLAEGGLGQDQLGLEVGTVGIVALAAVLPHRLVGVLPLELVQTLFVADEAERALLEAGDEKFLVMGGVGFVTGDTVTGTHGPVEKLVLNQALLVALETEPL